MSAKRNKIIRMVEEGKECKRRGVKELKRKK
jgi:hypothetical protein